MSFIRPEAQMFLKTWREALIGAAILLLGIYWLTGTGLLPWLGGAAALAGGAMMFTGIQRARFRNDQDGPGVVTIDEGRISYFGPLDGGEAEIREITLLSLDRSALPPVWILNQPGQKDLAIPINASGAGALFEIFTSLPGLNTERMLGALNTSTSDVIVIWAKRPNTLH